MAALSSAQQAVYSRAIELAATADHEQLVQIADAVSKVGHGPQGGKQTTTYNQNVKQDTTTTTAYAHADRRGVGFGG